MKLLIEERSALLPQEPYLGLLLMSAFPRPRDEQLAIAETFRDRADHRFWVAAVDGVPAGGCAVVDSGALTTIRYLAVAQALRAQGIGRALVANAVRNASGRVIEAETDDDATGFYRKCGFAIERLGEKYPGVVRYRCSYVRSV